MSTVGLVENIQEASLGWLGETPAECLDFLQKIKNYQLREGETNYLKPDASEFDDYKYAMLPEKHLIQPRELSEEFLRGGYTKYDNPNFFSRFANTKAFVHDYFSGVFEVDKRRIHLTSLPFLSLNAVCSKFSDSEHIVFINQGMLSILPLIYNEILPTFDPKTFGPSKPGFFNRLIDIYCSAYVSDKGVAHFGGQVELFHIGENWYFRRQLRQHLVKKTVAATKQPEPWKIPLSSDSAKYYANRGAITFLLAHEFAHAYLDHADARAATSEIRRSQSEIEAARKLLTEAGFRDVQIQRSLDRNHAYLVEQPIEKEADFWALGATVSLCEKLELEDAAARCLIFGALVMFYAWEIYDRVILMTRVGFEAADREISREQEFRNIVYGCTHPISSSRVHYLVEEVKRRSGPEGQNLVDFIQSADDMMKFNLDQMWPHLGHYEKDISKYVKESPYMEDMPEEVFEGLNAIGVSDFCRPVKYWAEMK
ncbi:hypothetical protein [Pontivivens nitratireducens]|uniref:Uncharacterized protein n=1 Tax=Pontivivens nitratireducens TaxID=2758038 RepID=A0A6G7VMM6_9RHOB|nr:hypothetical protein [Pontibrevibacter nitratireducens]QIK41047.1 hypothetical protein G8E03_09850 [Pontibrevibacter nitratireducens]